MSTKHYDLDAAIRKIPDFPKPGVLFYDITSILTNTEAFSFCIEKMISLYSDKEIDGVAAVEARGFLFAAPFAEKQQLPLVLIRKKGKLPGKTLTKSYSLEYGSAEIELHVDDIEKYKKYLLIDDLIATGGTLRASAQMIQEAGGIVTDIFGVVGLPFLKYDEVLSGFAVSTLINYDSE